MSALRISTDPGKLDIDMIHRFLSNESYWAVGMSRALLERALLHSLCFGCYLDERQVAFARVVTDRATFALLSDVFILDGHRGKGLSKWLMRCIIGHEDLQGLRRLLLLTSDAHGLYSQFGFEPLGAPGRFMEVLRADIYQSP